MKKLNKREIEMQILKSVYKMDNFKEVIQVEEPDFILKTHSHLKFGVEITEYYYSESNARLRKIPNYFNDLLYHQKYRHKYDKKQLIVDDVSIYTKKGDFKTISKAIVQHLPTRNEYLESLSEAIKTKNKKFEHYNQELNHINLIVAERSTIFVKLEKDNIYQHYFNSEFKNTIIKSPFREIYLLTRLKNESRVYIPLKLILFLSEVYLFGKIMELYSPNYDKPEEVFMRELAEYLLKQGFNDIYLRRVQEKIEIVYAAYGIVFAEESTQIYDYNNFHLPNHMENICEIKSSIFQEEAFVQAETEICTTYTFTTEIAYEINPEV